MCIIMPVICLSHCSAYCDLAVARSLAVGKADCLCSSCRFSGLGLAVLLFPVAAHLVQEGIPLS